MNLSRRQVVQSALLAATAAFLGRPARAQDFWSNQLRVSKPWAAPSKAGATVGEVYMVIENRGIELDRLLEVRTPVATRVTFAEEERGSVQQIAYIDLRARRETALRPGRVHIRLEGLKQPLVKGRPFPATLVFASTQSLDIRVDVDER